MAILDRVLAECHAIGAAMARGCSDVEVRQRERRNGTWVFALTADQPSPAQELLPLYDE